MIHRYMTMKQVISSLYNKKTLKRYILFINGNCSPNKVFVNRDPLTDRLSPRVIPDLKLSPIQIAINKLINRIVVLQLPIKFRILLLFSIVCFFVLFISLDCLFSVVSFIWLHYQKFVENCIFSD